MLVISSREFRENQKSYLDKVDEGVEILIQRGKNKAYKLFAVKADDTLMSKEEFFAKIDAARAETGGTVLRTKEDIREFFANL